MKRILIILSLLMFVSCGDRVIKTTQFKIGNKIQHNTTNDICQVANTIDNVREDIFVRCLNGFSDWVDSGAYKTLNLNPTAKHIFNPTLRVTEIRQIKVAKKVIEKVIEEETLAEQMKATSKTANEEKAKEERKKVPQMYENIIKEIRTASSLGNTEFAYYHSMYTIPFPKEVKEKLENDGFKIRTEARPCSMSKCIDRISWE